MIKLAGVTYSLVNFIPYNNMNVMRQIIGAHLRQVDQSDGAGLSDEVSRKYIVTVLMNGTIFGPAILA